MEHRNNIRAQNASDPSISELNYETTSLIQTHKSDIWREHLHTHWDHKHNTHTLFEDNTRTSQQNTNTTQNNTITFKDKTLTSPTQIANAFNKQFTNTVKHKTNRHIYSNTLQISNITLTTIQVQVAIKQSKNNNYTGTDKVNIRHLKNIGPLGLAYLTNMYNISLNNNIIPHTWTLAKIIPIPKPKPNKDMNIGT